LAASRLNVEVQTVECCVGVLTK